MRVLLVPPTATDRDIARRLVARIDQILGLPRAHTRDEEGVAWDPRGTCFTESLFGIFLHDSTGPSQLHGVVALVVDDPPDRILRRIIERDGTRRTLREWIQWLVANRGWVLRDGDLPDAAGIDDAHNPWTMLPPRDGEPGSADGQPIPEGEE